MVRLERLEWENNDDQKVAVVFKDPEGHRTIVGIFNDEYWAKTFLKIEGIGEDFTIMEVAQ